MTDADEKIIYVITKGEYSDYHICGVTTDKERAEYLRKFYTRDGDEALIEEYLDGAPDAGSYRELKAVWMVLIMHTGQVSADLYSYAFEPFTNEFMFINRFALNEIEKDFKAYVMAEDEEHAIKIAQDQMAKMLAEREGL